MLIVAENRIHAPSVLYRERSAVAGNFIEVVSKAASRPFATQLRESVPQRAGHGLGLGFPCEFCDRLGKPFRLEVPDVERHMLPHM